ncbi:MAG TPA: hypothetical protein DD670_08525, partial [Planctomycetaceae bacterium]|nr:hypothetical protein [Planctomycetaceae bacterium]
MGHDFVHAIRQLDTKAARQVTWYFSKNTDALLRQQAIQFGESWPDEKSRANAFHKVSGECPLGRAALVKYDWESHADKAEQWEMDATGQSCHLLNVLAKKYQ